MEGMEQDDGDSQGAEEAVGVGGGEGGDGGGAGGGGGGQGQVVVELTTEEDAAVQNVSAETSLPLSLIYSFCP